MKTYKIHLIRHGLTEDNIKGVYSGRNTTPLSDEGRAQLVEMKEKYIYPEAEFIFTSPLERCKQTAEILYPEKKAVEVAGLTEYNFGAFEGYTAEELSKKFDMFGAWLVGKKDSKPPFGESNEEFTKRVCESFIKICDGIIKAGTDNVVIITHGGVIGTVLSHFALPEAPVTDWLTPSGCGYTLSLSHFLWMSGQKLEAVKQIPLDGSEEQEGNYYDGWDYYPEDDFDISEYI
ncbi:MAG: histidine phosphatase family protein [Acutalibacteraceae bacterium]